MPRVRNPTKAKRRTFCARTCCTARPEVPCNTSTASFPRPSLYRQNPLSSTTSAELRNVAASRHASASLYLSSLMRATAFCLAACALAGSAESTAVATWTAFSWSSAAAAMVSCESRLAMLAVLMLGLRMVLWMAASPSLRFEAICLRASSPSPPLVFCRSFVTAGGSAGPGICSARRSRCPPRDPPSQATPTAMARQHAPS